MRAFDRPHWFLVTTPHDRVSVGRRRWLVLGGLGAAVVVLRLLSSCAAPADTGATLNLWSDPASWRTCSSPQVPGPAV